MLLASCATRQPEPPPARPAPAPGPALSAIHQQLSPPETVWHLRAGLNVAALGCASRAGPGIISDYNQFLKAKKPILAKAWQAKADRYADAGGQRAMDQAMTRLYNHFADPDAQAAFCPAAAAELKRALAAPDSGFEAYAAEALARLDRPFTGAPAAAPAPVALAVAGQPAPRAAPPAGAPPGVPSGWRIQLGAFSSAAAARAAWGGITGRNADIARMQPHYEPAPGTRLTRLQVKDVPSKADAIRLCALAAASGFDCLPVRAA